MKENKNLRCCGTCVSFYDVYVNGKGKCNKSCGGYTHADRGRYCDLWRYDENYFEKEEEF